MSKMSVMRKMRLPLLSFACISMVCLSNLNAQTMVNGSGLLADFIQPEPYSALNSTGDEFGISFDAASGNILYTTTVGGTSSVWKVKFSNEIEMGQPLSGNFNSNGAHRACVSMGTNGEGVGVAFTSGLTQANPSIYTVLRENGHFNLGHEVVELACDCFTSFPTLSPDGTRIVFASNRNGGAGGVDLWVSDRRSGLDWSPPVLLSSSLNSVGDEISPVFVSNDSLLYASNGYGGKGGFDIYLSVLREGAWQEPEPLAWLNSEFDDSDCILLPNGALMFASNRPGGKGGFDIWIARVRN
ncbi:MAG: PD40 domain-containing protein [Ignavibacteria bacterium]|nr:PD40 domain-containing protein [Ignavibacteria bacterium]